MLILVQKHPSPVGEDNLLARERYPSLCTACNLKTGYLFLLHSEHLTGYINKWDDEAMFEFKIKKKMKYFKIRRRSVRWAIADLLYFSTPHNLFYSKLSLSLSIQNSFLYFKYLFVRLAFKIAFLNEMKRDTNKAIE